MKKISLIILTLFITGCGPQDDVNGAIRRFADPEFHVEVFRVTRPITGVEHVIVLVPGADRARNEQARLRRRHRSEPLLYSQAGASERGAADERGMASSIEPLRARATGGHA